MDELAGKVAVITGRTSGIGDHTARIIVAEAASVVLAGPGRRRAKRSPPARLGPATSCVRADLAVEYDVAAVIGAATDRHGRFDCFFNSGISAPSRRVGLLDLAEFDRAIAVHVRGTPAGMKNAAPVMTAQGHGSIINTASIDTPVRA
jgi:NAD(P)-dependent dehydrogenase (short-subunit alcohol dehydrogenase family)